jgi:nicotinamidase-related amidase
MATRLEDLIRPANTALLTVEMQRAVVGDLTRIRPLADAVAKYGVVGNLAALMRSARAHKVPVVYCNAEFRADRKGTARNCGLIATLTKDPDHMLSDSASAEVVPELAPQPEDLISRRFHGLSPFTGTALDITLRNMGVRTVLATGVSINIAIFGLILEAVNLGYSAVLVRDCVAGFPDDYVEAVIRNSLTPLCTIASSAQVMEVWERG